jgi:hypothetical protein
MELSQAIKDNPEVVAAVISAITAIVVLILTGIGRYIYTRYSLSYKLKKEYNFEQKKNIKMNLARSKTPLIKAAEELNDRLWNLSQNVEKGWINVEKSNWGEQKRYYLRSTVYRFLNFMFWTLEAEKSIYSFDFSQADESDRLYLKYIKVLKHFFCEPNLLKELNYDSSHSTNHFYKDNLNRYAFYLSNTSNGVINFMEFENKLAEKGYNDIEVVFTYLTEIKNKPDNMNYNVIKGFHLFLMLFLNKYGLDYHYTCRNKFKELSKKNYANIKIKKGLNVFLERNKLKKEAKWIVKDLELSNTDLIKNHLCNSNAKTGNKTQPNSVIKTCQIQ